MAATNCLFWCRQADHLSNFSSRPWFKSTWQAPANKTICLRLIMLCTNPDRVLGRQNSCTIWTRGTHEANAQDNSGG